MIYFLQTTTEQQPTKKGITVMKTTDFSGADFNTAIATGNLIWARNMVAQTLPDKEGIKLGKYRTILELALDSGQLSFALEVAPFCGHIITLEEIRFCLKVSISEGNLTEVLLCKERLHEEFKWEEVYTLRTRMIEKRIPLPYVLTQLGTLSPLNPLRDAFLRVVDLHVPMWKLQPDEQLLVRVLKITK